MPETDGGTIGFRSAGSWTSQDLISFTTAVSGIYDALVVVRVRQRLEATYLDSLEVALRRYEKFFGHFYPELYHMWRDAMRSWRKQNAGPMPPFLPVPFGFGDLGGAIPSDEQIYTNLERYSFENEQCRVHRIHVASPGGFSFEGIGEIIEQFRELLKDVWWRNRAERARDQLELIERYLRSRRENPELDLPLPPYLRGDAYLAKAVQGHVIELQTLEHRGKLEAVTQHLDYIPE